MLNILVIHSSYKVISLLPFLSEKHICILFLIKHTVLIECINIKMVLYETGIGLNIKFQHNKGYIFVWHLYIIFNKLFSIE